MHNGLTSQFPLSTPVMIIWVVALLVVTALFVHMLILLNRKGRRLRLAIIFGLLLLGGTAVHTVVLTQSGHTVTDGNWVQIVLVSLMAALEMFIAQTVVFDDIIAAVIFHEPALLMAYVSVFVLVVTFTLSMLLLIMPRRLRDHTWLRSHLRQARRPRKNHIFLGLDNHSIAFARTILKEWEAQEDRKNQGEVILVEFPDASQHRQELSIGELFSNVFGQRKEASVEMQIGSERFVLLKGRNPESSEARVRSLPKAIGLPRLAPWLENPSTTIYLLSGIEEENARLLKYLATDASVQAKIFCYSHRVNSYSSLMGAMGERVRMLNLPEMSFNEIKQNQPDIHPVRFAAVAKGKDGQPLGYVEKGLTSMVIGFGEMGQEALRFLYEYSAFVGKDLQPLPNTFKVYDPQVDSLKGDFLNRTPALRYDADISWSSASMGSSQFWLEFAMTLSSLTYVVVAVDHGERNVEIAVQLLQEAARHGKDLSSLCILLRATQANPQMLQLIDFYNRSYCPEGVSVLHPFGLPERIWNLDVVSGKRLKGEASQGSLENWRERSSSILSRGGNVLLNRKELMRKQAVDIGRALYTPSLLAQCPERLLAAGSLIPDELDAQKPVHFTGSKADYKVLEYLAAGEHLHWMRALEASGYIDGAGVQDELNKKINGLVPYQDLPDEEARHKCWLALKKGLQ